MAIYKNKAGQKIAVYAYHQLTGAAKTGDAGNITAQIGLDGAAPAATNDANPTEWDATDLPGVYLFEMTQAEMNADVIALAAVSATADIVIDPLLIDTEPEVRSANLTQILGTTLTETAGLIAAGFKKFFNVATPTGTVNSLPDAAPDTAGGLVISDAGGFDIDNRALTAAQLANLAAKNTRTTVYVAHDGNDVTSGATLKAAVEGANAGTLVRVSDGTFDLGATGSSYIEIPSGVDLRGSGMDITIIKAEQDGAGYVIAPTSGGLIADLTAYHTSTDNAGSGIRTGIGGIAASVELIGNRFERVKSIGGADGWLFEAGAAYDLTFVGCVGRTFLGGDAIAFFVGSTATTLAFKMVDCDFATTSGENAQSGLSLRFDETVSGFDLQAQLIRTRLAVDGHTVSSASATGLVAHITNGNARFDLIDCNINLPPDGTESGTDIDISGPVVVTVSGTHYRPASVSTANGAAIAIIPTPGAMDAAGNAIATSDNQTTILNRLGAWTGSGINTILGAFKAVLNKLATMPSDIGGTGDPATDSIEAICDSLSTIQHLTGAYSITVTVTDGTDPLESAKVRVTKGAQTDIGETDASGNYTFSLDAGTWTVAVTFVGYTFAATTRTVTGEQIGTLTDDLVMTPVSITASTPGNVTGYGTVIGNDGLAEAGATISLRVIDGSGAGNGLVFNDAVRTVLSNSVGLYEFANLTVGSRCSCWRGSESKAIEFVVTDTDTQEIGTFKGSP